MSGIEDTLREVQLERANEPRPYRGLVTAGEFSKHEFRPAEAIAGPMVRRGWRTIVLGHSGIGKSSIAVGMMRSVLHGDEFMGYDNPGGGTVLLIDLEHDETIAQIRVGQAVLGSRWRDLGSKADVADAPGADRLHIGLWNNGIDLAEQGGLDQQALLQAIDQTRPDLVLIDPVTKAFMGNPSDHEMVSKLSRFLDSLRNHYGFALVTPFHPRKPQVDGNSKVSMHDTYGAAAWTWGAEIVLGVSRDDAGFGNLEVLKDRSGDLQVGLKFTYSLDSRWQGAELLARSDGVEPPSAREAVDAILNMLASNPGVWFEGEQAIEQLGLERPTVRRAWRSVIDQIKRRELPGYRTANVGPVTSLRFDAGEVRHLRSVAGSDGTVGS